MTELCSNDVIQRTERYESCRKRSQAEDLFRFHTSELGLVLAQTESSSRLGLCDHVVLKLCRSRQTVYLSVIVFALTVIPGYREKRLSACGAVSSRGIRVG